MLSAILLVVMGFYSHNLISKYISDQMKEFLMINPNRVHRSKAVIVSLYQSKFDTSLTKATVKVARGHTIEGYVPVKSFSVGQTVNIQAQFSIMSDMYIVRTMRKIRH